MALFEHLDLGLLILSNCQQLFLQVVFSFKGIPQILSRF